MRRVVTTSRTAHRAHYVGSGFAETGTRDAAISYRPTDNLHPARRYFSVMPAPRSTSRAHGHMDGVSREDIRPGSARRQPFCDVRMTALRCHPHCRDWLTRTCVLVLEYLRGASGGRWRP